MKVTFFIFITFTICYAQEDGRYIADDSGAYVPTGDEGQYIPDDSGKYIPDYSGLYHHDASGRYINDGSGKYQDLGRPGRRKSVYFNNLETAGTVLSKHIVKPKVTSINLTSNLKNTNNFENLDNGKWKIIRQISDNGIKGYHWEFETENKINAEEFGKFDKADREEKALKTNGYFSYTGPDNIIYSIMYTADEKGFIPKGSHLPISLQKALAQISSTNN